MDILSYNKAVLSANKLSQFLESGADTKTIVLVLPKVTNLGAQSLVVQFPHDGKIVGVSVFCSKAGVSGDTEIIIEKSPVDGYTGGEWTEILSSPAVIPANELTSTADVSLVSDETINRFDYIRLNVPAVSEGAEGFTVQLTVKIYE